MKDISVIIPFVNTTDTLPRLFNSIPNSENIEIILVENSDTPLSKAQIGINRNYILLNAKASRFAGGARNVGLEAAKGKWLVFADSDDFFSKTAFEVFQKYIESSYDLIYFGCDSVYDDTLEQSDRHIPFNKIIKDLENDICTEMKARLYHVVPWAKMVRRDLVEKHIIRFDEVIAANDIYFSTQCGYYCANFHYDSAHVYVVTTRKGSLANKWNCQILQSRYLVGLRRNKFLKENSLPEYQVSVMIYLYKALQMNFITFIKFVMQAIKYRQNIFIGFRNWLNTLKNTISSNKSNKKYIVKD